MNTTTAPAGLPPSARRLLTALTSMDDTERAQATNAELAAHIGTSTAHPRTVTVALAALRDAGLVRIERVAPHPVHHPTGRLIAVVGDNREGGR